MESKLNESLYVPLRIKPTYKVQEVVMPSLASGLKGGISNSSVLLTSCLTLGPCLGFDYRIVKRTSP